VVVVEREKLRCFGGGWKEKKKKKGRGGGQSQDYIERIQRREICLYTSEKGVRGLLWVSK